MLISILRPIARAIWGNRLVKELVLLVGTSAALVLVTQFRELDVILNEDVSPEQLRAWLDATGIVLALTIAKQVLAWSIARLSGAAL